MPIGWLRRQDVTNRALEILNVTPAPVVDPHFSGDMGPWAIQIVGSTLVYGGDFGYVGGAPRAGMARFTIS